MNNDISKRYKFSLDSKSNNTLNSGQLLFNYGDDITLEITVTDGGVVKNIANCEVDLITVNQNTTDVLIHRFADGGITVREDNTIVIVCKSDYVDRLGTNVGQLIIRDEDQSITTQMFSYQTSTTLVSDEISGSVDGINTIEDIMKVIANANLEIENFNRVTTGLDSKIQATNTLVDNLTDRVNIEITSTNSIVNQVKLEESKRVQSEDARSSNEVSRVNSEYTRVQNEHVRSANEQDRITKETQRVQSETARESAENDRVSEENIRKTNEISRANSESDRVLKEKERVTEEEARKVAEDSRKSAETTRAQSESQRVQSENTRSSNESNRVAKETERVNNENARKTAETARVSAETSRKNAELDRVTAEAERVAAEKYRADKFYEMEHEYDESITAEVVNNRQGYDGVVYADMYEARKADYETLDNKFGDFTHSTFSGVGLFKADNTKEGLVKDISVKGRTLQNLAGPIYTSSNQNTKGSVTMKGDDVTYGSPTYRIQTFNPVYKLKSNTTYTCIINVTELTNVSEIGSYFVYDDGETIYNLFSPNVLGINRKKFTTSKEIKQLALYLPSATGTIATVKELMLLEGDHTNTPISQLPYGEGIYSVGEAEAENGKYAVKVKSCGKNLFDIGSVTRSIVDGGYKIINNGVTFTATGYNQGVFFMLKNLTIGKSYVLSGTNINGAIVRSSVIRKDVDVSFINNKISFTALERSGEIHIKTAIPSGLISIENIQLEESSTSSPYEPYKESNIKYLLDEPLRSLPNGTHDEIVGDKHIKRINKIILDGTRTWSKEVALDGNIRFYSLELSDIGGISEGYSFTNQLNNRFVVRNPYDNHLNSLWAFYNSTSKKFYIRISLDGSDSDIQLFKTNLSQNPVVLYYELATPIITDIGIHTLKGYDGVTNLIMDNTLVSEISARVPIDITSEIEANRKDFNGNLYPSMYEARKHETAYLLDKINNAEYLEKTGINITATNSYDGLTKDLSIKGRTLQNLIKSSTLSYKCFSNDETNRIAKIPVMLKQNTIYTLILNTSGTVGTNPLTINIGSNSVPVFISETRIIGDIKIKIDTTGKTSIDYLWIYPNGNTDNPTLVTISNIRLLEGDYSTTPLSELPYVEGIQSTGESDVVEGKYPISVKSCGKNLINAYDDLENYFILDTDGSKTINNDWRLTKKVFKLKPSTTYVISETKSNYRQYKIVLLDSNEKFIKTVKCEGSNSYYSFTTTDNTVYFKLNYSIKVSETAIDREGIQIEESSTATSYEPYRESAIKYLLDEPLRGLPNGVADEIIGNQSIRRFGKVVLDGSENWEAGLSLDNSRVFYCRTHKVVAYGLNIICDKFIPRVVYQTDMEGIYTLTSNEFAIRINKSKLSSEEASDFKVWLSKNPVTVYYELATPIITTLDQKLVLNTYDTTTHISSDNTLLPTITTKVPSNVQAVVVNLMEENKELNNQVSTLSVENEELKATNEVQDEMIDVTMCATDEMFTMLEPLLAQVMKIDTLNTNNKEVVNPMVDMYVAMVQRGLKTIDQVPARYREQVEAILAELDK